MKSKQELLKELKEIENKEQEVIESNKKKENYKRFLERSPDFMVGKAHCELNFISKRYASDRGQKLMPSCVSVSGNCGVDYYPVAEVTDSTKIYFHNVWSESVRREFQDELNELAYKYVNKASKDLRSVLEMMGLQSLHYYMTEKFFLEEDLLKVKEEVRLSQAEVLSNYPDEDFIKLLRTHSYRSSESDVVERSTELDLSHSRNICMNYLLKNRPALAQKINEKRN